MEVNRLLDGRLKLRHLVLVDALSERGSIVGAAAHLHMSQPAATRVLQELETLLGLSLYERHPRGVSPTIFGTAFTEHARAVLAQVTSAGRHLNELANAELGTVTVGTHLAGSNMLLPRAIVAVKRRHPHVTVIVHEAMPEGLLVDLDSGRVDFIVGRLTTAVARPSTVQRTLYDEPITLVARRDHPALSLASATLADLVSYPWILPGPETVLRGELERAFIRNELSLPDNRVECTSILTVRQILAESDAIAALPMLIAYGDERITTLPVSLTPMSHTVGVTLPMERPTSPSTTVLLAQLQVVAEGMRRSMERSPVEVAAGDG